MLSSPRNNSLDSLFKEVRVFKDTPPDSAALSVMDRLCFFPLFPLFPSFFLLSFNILAPNDERLA